MVRHSDTDPLREALGTLGLWGHLASRFPWALSRFLGFLSWLALWQRRGLSDLWICAFVSRMGFCSGVTARTSLWRDPRRVACFLFFKCLLGTVAQLVSGHPRWIPFQHDQAGQVVVF